MSVSNEIDVAKRIEIIVAEGQLRPRNAGPGKLKAICSFHSEKEPSLYITRRNALWYCFGCNAGGDVIRFVQMKTGISDFQEVLTYIDDKYGTHLFEVPEGTPCEELEGLYKINEYAANYYHNSLQHALNPEQNHPVKNYITKRGIGSEVINRYRIGYGGDTGTHLLSHLKNSSEITADLITKSQLFYSVPDSREIGDRFSKRLIFPISKDGRIVGFSGRRIDDKEENYKYTNSPTTPLFQKSHCLYGWDEAKGAVQEKKTVILVEGFMDALSMAQAGFPNTAALMGTSLSEFHVKSIRSVTKRVVFFLDSDAPGLRALAEWVLPVAIAGHLDCRILYAGEELYSRLGRTSVDPDALCRTFGPEKIQEFVRGNLYRVEDFLYNYLIKYGPPEMERFQNAAIALFARVFKDAANPAKEWQVAEFLSSKIHIDAQLIVKFFCDESKLATLSSTVATYERDRKKTLPEAVCS
ncbi:CHC2 zinc finger domain-containing protein [bacterium]|nr:CHC2 zinc finger domain-containing protein [bacterium]